MLSNICLKYETYVISFWFIMQIAVHLAQYSKAVMAEADFKKEL